MASTFAFHQHRLAHGKPTFSIFTFRVVPFINAGDGRKAPSTAGAPSCLVAELTRLLMSPNLETDRRRMPRDLDALGRTVAGVDSDVKLVGLRLVIALSEPFTRAPQNRAQASAL